MRPDNQSLSSIAPHTCSTKGPAAPWVVSSVSQFQPLSYLRQHGFLLGSLQEDWVITFQQHTTQGCRHLPSTTLPRVCFGPRSQAWLWASLDAVSGAWCSEGLETKKRTPASKLLIQEMKCALMMCPVVMGTSPQPRRRLCLKELHNKCGSQL